MSVHEDPANMSAAQRIQVGAANLLCDIKHACKSTQKSILKLVSGVNVLVDLYLNFLVEKMSFECSSWDGYLTLQKVNSVLLSLKGQSVFEGVQTNIALESFLQEKSGGKKVLLRQIVLKTKRVIRKGIPRKVPWKFGYCVPFLSQLEQLLNCEDVLKCVDSPLPAKEGVFQSVTHGMFYRNSHVVAKHGPGTLCFYMHIDDVEPCDSLKSKAGKHNLRLMYWVLGNIYPELRSSLKAINLLAIVKAKIAKEKGNHHFLRDFLDGIKMLGTEGVDFNIGGTVRRFYGILLFASADNPAAANLGGFKETHSALRPCRECMVKSDSLNDSFVECFHMLRKIDEHEQQLDQVESHMVIDLQPRTAIVDICDLEGAEESGDSDVEVDVPEEKYLDHKNPSVNFGVNARSPLSEAPGFDVTKCLPQDIMHVFAEGVVELVCRKVLKDLCVPTKLPGKKGCKRAPLSLKDVNKAIETNCDLGHLNVNRPSPIELSHLKGSKLKQSASQMLVLLHLLPFLIYQVCPKEKLDLVIKLINLVDLCMSFELSLADIDRIADMVEDFCTSFVKIYPNVRSLKLHCLIHIAMQARLFGPLRQQWCFRFEAMHAKFTAIAALVRTKKNVAFSCASRYLSERNNQIMKGKEGRNYLYDGDTIKKPTPFKISDLPEKKLFLEKFHGIEENSVVVEVRQLSKQGHVWQKGVAILLEKKKQNSVFGRIEKLFVKEDHYVFVYNEYKTEFVPAVNAFEIKKCERNMQVTCLSDLIHRHPVTRFSFNIGSKTVAFLLLQSPGGNL